MLANRPLVDYPVEALREVCDRVGVVCKPETPLPEVLGAERWDEPHAPRHPITGIVHALEQASEPVLVCAGDMPLVTAEACRTLIEAAVAAREAAAVVAGDNDVLQPLFGVYRPSALDGLVTAPAGSRLKEIVAALDPVTVAVPATVLLNVNTAADLRRAELVLGARHRAY